MCSSHTHWHRLNRTGSFWELAQSGQAHSLDPLWFALSTPKPTPLLSLARGVSHVAFQMIHFDMKELASTFLFADVNRSRCRLKHCRLSDRCRVLLCCLTELTRGPEGFLNSTLCAGGAFSLSLIYIPLKELLPLLSRNIFPQCKRCET